jgi:hypothetical protein
MSEAMLRHFIRLTTEVGLQQKANQVKKRKLKALRAANRRSIRDNRDLRFICLKIHSARIAMNEKAVIEGLNELDGYFREGNEN